MLQEVWLLEVCLYGLERKAKGSVVERDSRMPGERLPCITCCCAWGCLEEVGLGRLQRSRELCEASGLVVEVVDDPNGGLGDVYWDAISEILIRVSEMVVRPRWWCIREGD